MSRRQQQEIDDLRSTIHHQATEGKKRQAELVLRRSVRKGEHKGWKAELTGVIEIKAISPTGGVTKTWATDIETIIRESREYLRRAPSGLDANLHKARLKALGYPWGGDS